MNPLALPPQTLLGAGPLGLIEAAEAAGYNYVGLRVRPAMPADPTPDLATEKALLRDVEAALRGSRVRLLDIEAIRLTPEFEIDDTQAHFDLCDQLGARYLVVGATDRDASRRLDNFEALVDRARRHRVVLTTEFAPYMALNTLQSIVELVHRFGADTVSILSDPLHLTRSGDVTASLAAIDPEFFAYTDFCDAPLQHPGADGLMAEAREHRLYPGEGELPLHAYLDALPPGLPLRVEVPRRDTVGISYVERAVKAIECTRRVLASRD